MNTSCDINASTMVIRSARGYWRYGLDIFLTWMAWIFFSYLIARGLWLVLAGEHDGIDLPWLAPLLPGFSDLGTYLLAMLMLGGLLLLWARYNFLRFRGSKRRAPAAAMDDHNLLRHYGIPAESLQCLRQQPVCVIHHAPDGRIMQVASGPLGPLSAPSAALR